MKKVTFNAGNFPAFFYSSILSSKGCTFSKKVPKNDFVVNNEMYENLHITAEGKIKKRRNSKLQDFKEIFQSTVQKNKYSILCMVVDALNVNSINYFIKYFKYRKLKKLGIKATSHIRINDIGKKHKRPHWHVFIAVSKINNIDLTQIFKPSKSHKYKGILMDSSFSLIPYCQKKELYQQDNRRTWSSSHLFKFPRKLIPIDGAFYSTLNAQQINSYSKIKQFNSLEYA